MAIAGFGQRLISPLGDRLKNNGSELSIPAYLLSTIRRPEVAVVTTETSGDLKSIDLKNAAASGDRIVRVLFGKESSSARIEIITGTGISEEVAKTISGSKAQAIAKVVLKSVLMHERRKASKLIRDIEHAMRENVEFTQLDGEWAIDPKDRLAATCFHNGIKVRCTYTYDEVRKRLDGWRVQAISGVNNQILETRMVHYESPLQLYFADKYQKARLLEIRGRGEHLPPATVVTSYLEEYRNRLAEIRDQKAAEIPAVTQEPTMKRLLDNPGSIMVCNDPSNGDYWLQISDRSNFYSSVTRATADTKHGIECETSGLSSPTRITGARADKTISHLLQKVSIRLNEGAQKVADYLVNCINGLETYDDSTLVSLVNDNTRINILHAHRSTSPSWEMPENVLEHLVLRGNPIYIRASRDLEKQWFLHIMTPAFTPNDTLDPNGPGYHERHTIAVPMGSAMHEHFERKLAAETSPPPIDTVAQEKAVLTNRSRL